MSQTMLIIALSAVAVVSALLSFVAWSRLAHPPTDLPSPPDASVAEESPKAGPSEEEGDEPEAT